MGGSSNNNHSMDQQESSLRGGVRSLFRRRTTTNHQQQQQQVKSSMCALPSSTSLRDASSSAFCCLSNDTSAIDHEKDETAAETITESSLDKTASSSSSSLDDYEEDDVRRSQHSHLEERLESLQAMLAQDTLSHTERTNLLFATGRLLVHMGRYEEALSCYRQELQMTKALLAKTKGKTTTETPGVILIARIHLAMARVAKRGLQDSALALHHYQKALKIQVAVYKSAVKQSKKDCPTCCLAVSPHQQSQAQSPKGRRGNRARVGVSSSTLSSSAAAPKSECCHACVAMREKVNEAALAVEETRRHVGRIHFEQGNVDLAVRLSVQRYRIDTPAATTTTATATTTRGPPVLSSLPQQTAPTSRQSQATVATSPGMNQDSKLIEV